MTTSYATYHVEVSDRFFEKPVVVASRDARVVEVKPSKWWKFWEAGFYYTRPDDYYVLDEIYDELCKSGKYTTVKLVAMEEFCDGWNCWREPVVIKRYVS